MKIEGYKINIMKRRLFFREEFVNNPIGVYEALANISYIEEISVSRNKKGGLVTCKIEGVPFKFYIERGYKLNFIVMKNYKKYLKIIRTLYFIVKRTLFLYRYSGFYDSDIYSTNILFQNFDFEECYNIIPLEFIVWTNQEDYSVYVFDFLKDKYLVAKI